MASGKSSTYYESKNIVNVYQRELNKTDFHLGVCCENQQLSHMGTLVSVHYLVSQEAAPTSTFTLAGTNFDLSCIINHVNEYFPLVNPSWKSHNKKVQNRSDILSLAGLISSKSSLVTSRQPL